MVTPATGSAGLERADDTRVIETEDSPGSISSPFCEYAKLWRDAGWLGVIPLPEREKSPPPTNYTGNKSTRILFPSNEQISAWCVDPDYAHGNLGLALGWSVDVDGEQYQVIGVDVDDYESGGRTKTGGSQLKHLETQLGELPATVISSARTDGVSGIRFYLAPADAEFRGQADKAIEIIQRKHRYAVTWPSAYPLDPTTGEIPAGVVDDGRYHLYPPGVAPDGVNYRDEIASVTTLAKLPDAWVAYLKDAHGSAITPIDSASSPSELSDWATETFNNGDEGSACDEIRRNLAYWRAEIASDPTSHPKIRDAHWQIIKAAREGHTGWLWALEEIKAVYVADVADRSKRTYAELRGELFRSLTGALRKTKAAPGSHHVNPSCTCAQSTGIKVTAAQSNIGTQNGIGGRTPDEIHSGHVRMAHRLANAYKNRLLSVHGIGWHYWDGKRWQADDSEARVKRAAMKVIADAINETIGNPTDEAKRLRSDARKCESASGLDGMIKVAKALKPFAATVDDIDADPYVLNVANGTVDLHTGILRPHDPADRITKICNGAYLADADDPARGGANWSAFLERIQPDDDMRSFTQRLTGVGLVGRIVEHILPILVGKGANGKSVFCEAIQFALGDYAITAEPDLLMHRDGVHPTGEMDLRGCRWVIVSESEKDRRLAETTVKRLTADAKVRARRMRQDFVEFKASHTLMLVTNHKPKVSGDDMAIWRRLRVVPFNVGIPKAEQDKNLGEKLQLEADAVISWAIAGLVAYWQRGLDEPKQVRFATEKYHQESDAIGRFIAERCETGPNHKVEPKRLHEAWIGWQTEDGCEPVGLKAFNVAMEERGYASGRPSNGKRFRRGIGLRAIAENSQITEQKKYS